MAGADDAVEVERAEQVYLRAEGVDATAITVELKRLGGHIRLLEAGGGPPIVFIHGTMTAGASWARLVADLQDDFRCIMIDRPGCGLSPMIQPEPVDLSGRQRLADNLVIDVLDGLDVDVAAVVSTSLGGWFAFRSAAAHPERISSIVGMGFQAGAPIAGAPLFMRWQPPEWMMPRRPKVTKGIVRATLKMAGMRRAVESGAISDEMLSWMLAVFAKTDTGYYERRTAPAPLSLRGPVTEHYHDPDLLARITVPVHLFWGEEDPFGAATEAKAFAANLDSAAVQMVGEAGHAPWLDAPEAAALAVRNHLG